MKATMKTILAVVFCFVAVSSAWAGGPAETMRDWAARAAEQSGDRSAEAVPQAGYGYYVDLMSNSSDPVNGGWVSFLVVTNWDLSVRIRVITQFIPTGGTPADIITRQHYVNPNDIAYLDANTLGFNSYGKSNWYGLVYNDTDNFFTCGVLLYHTEFGLTWIPAVYGGTL